MNQLISEINITPVKPSNGLIAFASIILNDCLYLGSIAIMTRPEGGYRLVYPTKQIAAKQLNIFHPINKNFAMLIHLEVVKKLEEVMNKSNARHSYAYNTKQ